MIKNSERGDVKNLIIFLAISALIISGVIVYASNGDNSRTLEVVVRAVNEEIGRRYSRVEQPYFDIKLVNEETLGEYGVLAYGKPFDPHRTIKDMYRYLGYTPHKYSSADKDPFPSHFYPPDAFDKSKKLDDRTWIRAPWDYRDNKNYINKGLCKMGPFDHYSVEPLNQDASYLEETIRYTLKELYPDHFTGTFEKWHECLHILQPPVGGMPGKEKVTAELGLCFLAYNLRRAINMVGVHKLIAAM